MCDMLERNLKEPCCGAHVYAYCALYCYKYANVSNNCHAMITVPLLHEHGICLTTV
jgi:hypothetical protein